MSKKNLILTLLSVAAVSSGTMTSGCGASQPATPPAPAAAKETPAPASASEPVAATEAAPAPEAAPVMDGAAAPAPAAAAETPAQAAPAAGGAPDALHKSLIGTKWKLGDFDVQFKDEKTVSLNGGPLTMMTGGKGLDASYSYTGGTLEVVAMGQTKKGTWDGKSLVVDGTAATLQQ